MSSTQKINRCIWLVSTIRQYERITLKDLSRKWVEDKVSDGNALARSSFNKYRDEIFDIFGLIIECDDQYRYYFANPESVNDGSIESWLLSTMTVSTVLSESAMIKDRIVLENIPEGELFLSSIIEAIKLRRRMRMGYQKFGFESNERMIEPYALKLWHRRWYLLARTEGVFKTFSLDRMLSLEMTDERFEMIKDFSPEKYYGEYFGVLTDGTPMAHVVLRAYGRTADYLRTLPLHDSQQELESTEEYTDFSLDIRPTADFIAELLSYNMGLKVLEPADLRLKICEELKRMLNRY